MIGDVVGKPGRLCVRDMLPRIRENYRIDVTVANGENLAGGTGINEKTAGELFSYGVDIITTGNHVWDKKESLPLLAREPRILRPANYPAGAPGKGAVVFKAAESQIAILNLSGRVYMSPLDCPFRLAEQEVARLRELTPLIIVDFHAEATSEKIALARFLDGKVSAVLGTHTHVQTADARIFPGGTAYLSDVGMTGPYDSCLGVDTDTVIRKFLRQLPERFEVAKSALCQFNAAVVEITEDCGRAQSIETIFDLLEV
jgi:metallophosphoesterase (TIGR00282 family)